MRLIDADALIDDIDGDLLDSIAEGRAIEKIENAPTMGYNNHEVACIIADILGDACACNWNDNDEWLPNHCEFRDTVCPAPVGVACWEQYLTNLDKRPKEES